MTDTIIHMHPQADPPILCAADRLREALAIAYDRPYNTAFHLVDVTCDSLPPIVPQQHGLTGPQAHRVIVEPGRVLLLGHGSLGVAYAVERFRRDHLGIDPLSYWTGITPRCTNPTLAPSDTRVGPPAFAQRIYFENDADELINWSGRRLQLEWPVWKELIDTLLALGYSGVELCDSLGRSEFLYWDHYRAEGRYEFDRDLIVRVMDYVRRKGMIYHAPVSLGSPFRTLAPDHDCWCRHGDEWREIWAYLLTETPMRHADVLGIGVGDPLWDGDYRCRCPQCSAKGVDAVRLEVGAAVLDAVRRYAADKTITINLYNHANSTMPLSSEVPLVIEYSDQGYADFVGLPAEPPQHPSAALVHAGYWLDHTVLNPYLERIGEVVQTLHGLGMTRWLRVNGQSFKPFMLTIEACAAAAWDPAAYEPRSFARGWAARRLGNEASDHYLSFLDALLEANEAVRTHTKERGYAQLLNGHIYPLLRELSGDNAAVPNIDLVKCRDTDSILRCFGDDGSSAEHARRVRRATQATLALAQRVSDATTDPQQQAFVDDQVLFPSRLFDTAAALYESLVALRDAVATGNAEAALMDTMNTRCRALWDLCLDGPAHPKWRDWYLPNRQRVFGTPPRPEAALAVRQRLAPLASREPNHASLTSSATRRHV